MRVILENMIGSTDKYEQRGIWKQRTKENMQSTAIPHNCRDRAFVAKYFPHVEIFGKWSIWGISLRLYKVLKLQNSVWKIIWFPTGSLRFSQTVWEHLRKSMIANLNWRNAGCFLFSFAGLANTICRKFATILSLQSNITLSFHRQSGTVASIYCMENP